MPNIFKRFSSRLSPQPSEQVKKQPTRESTNELGSVEALEQRLCLGSMHAGVAGWGGTTQQDAAAEVRLNSTSSLNSLSLTPTSGSTGSSTETPANLSPVRRVANTTSSADSATPELAALSGVSQQTLLNTQIAASLSSALETDAERIISKLVVTEQESVTASHQTQTGLSSAASNATSQAAENAAQSQNLSTPGLGEVNFEHQTSESATALDLASVGLELDEHGNASGFMMSEIAQASGYDAWWTDADQPVVIGYDFRDVNGVSNQISAEQQQLAIEALEAWSDATDRNIVFERDTSAGAERIINIGVGDLQAVGHVSGAGAVLGLGGGAVTDNGEGYDVNGCCLARSSRKLG